MSYSESELYRLPKDILIKIICQISTELKEKHDKKYRAVCIYLDRYSVELKECNFCDKWMIDTGSYVVFDESNGWEENDFEKQYKYLIYDCQKCGRECMCYQHSHFPEKPEDYDSKFNSAKFFEQHKDEVLCETCFKNLK